MLPSVPPVKTRLDPVVKIEEKREEKTLLALADANRSAQSAQSALQAAEQRAREDARTRGTASDWQLAEAAHTRALADLAHAHQKAASASEAAEKARETYLGARARAEAMRRLVDAKHQEILRERESREAKEIEELQILRWKRPPRAA